MIYIKTKKNKQNINFKKREFFSNFFNIFTTIVAFLLGLILLAIICFIFVQAINGFKSYGFNAIFNTLNFDIATKPDSNKKLEVSFFSPFIMTIITSLIALIIAVPIGIKTSIFLKFRVKEKYKKILRISIETLSGIPSVVFGLFAIESLKSVVNIIGISSYSILNASIMLAFMVLPTIIAITYNSLNAVDKNIFTNSIALGCTKTKAIYKVYKKSARNGIIVGIVLAFGRSIGETMSLSMILQSENDYQSILNSGNFLLVASSNLKPISVIISSNMFTENSTEQTRSLLFGFGFILFLIIMILNLIIIRITKTKKNFKSNLIFKKIWDFFDEILNKFFLVFEYLNAKLLFKNSSVNRNYQKNNFKNFYSFYKLFFEYISTLLCLIFLTWLSLNIIVNGIQTWNNNSSTVFLYTKNTTGQALLNTILIIFVSILISFPISLLSAIYINEISKSKFAKQVINFFLDSLGSTPSILFGMFGLLFFIQTLELTSDGNKGFSLISGALTISILILPIFTRTIQHSLNSVSKDLRLNGLALGASNFRVIFKIVLPAAFLGLVTSVILTIGRILSETAPLFLTAGLTSSKQTRFLNAGQTLTTRIFAQLSNTNIKDSLNVMYESAFLVLLLIFSLIFLGYFIIPNSKNIINSLNDVFFKLKISFKNMLFINEKK